MHQTGRFGERVGARERGYDSRWEKARKTFLARSPLCVKCEKQGRVTPATVVDHVIPHRGDRKLFWDSTNWQPLCVECHNRDKQREELRGFDASVGIDGWPIDPRHPANRQGA